MAKEFSYVLICTPNSLVIERLLLRLISFCIAKVSRPFGRLNESSNFLNHTV